MFTGIVQYLGKVETFEPNPFGAFLHVDVGSWPHASAVGESIAVNGCCLTVADVGPGTVLRFDVIRQTLDVTALGDCRAGAAVNLEHAVTPQTMLGGHIVQGHIDGVGAVRNVVASESEYRLRISPTDSTLMDSIVEKGSVGVHGVSLTVAAVEGDWFEVALIPTTLKLTNLGSLKVGARVNLETDYLAKIVINYMKRVHR